MRRMWDHAVTAPEPDHRAFERGARRGPDARHQHPDEGANRKCGHHRGNKQAGLEEELERHLATT